MTIRTASYFAQSLESEFLLSNLPNFESLYFGMRALTNAHSFIISHNPKLKIIKIEDSNHSYSSDYAFNKSKVFELNGNWNQLIITILDLPVLTTLIIGNSSFPALPSLCLDSNIDHFILYK